MMLFARHVAITALELRILAPVSGVWGRTMGAEPGGASRCLALLVPTFLGVLWEQGMPARERGGAKAWVGSQLELGANCLRPHAWMLSAWEIVPGSNIAKVF